jgi:hypothetical protein
VVFAHAHEKLAQAVLLRELAEQAKPGTPLLESTDRFYQKLKLF